MLSGIGSTIAQGMAFGTGSAIAHRAVGAVAGGFGGSQPESQSADSGAPTVGETTPAPASISGPDCSMFEKDFTLCMQKVGLSMWEWRPAWC